MTAPAAARPAAADGSRLAAARRNRVIAICLALFAGALLVRMASFLHERGVDAFGSARMYGDESEYDALARRILAGTGYRQTGLGQGIRKLPSVGQPTAFRTPGMPALLAGIYAVTGGEIGTARMGLLVLASLIPPLLYLLVLTLFGRVPLALGVAGAWILMPTSLILSGVLLGEEMAALFLTGIALLTALAERKQSRWLAATAGLLLGLGALTRGVLVFAPAAFAVWLFIRGKRGPAVLLLVTTAILPGAWIARNAVVMGIPTLSTQAPENVWIGNHRWARGSWAASSWEEQKDFLRSKYPDFDRMDEIGVYRMFSREAKVVVAESPRRLLWLMPRKVAVFFSPRSYLATDWVLAVAIPFFLAGLVILARDRQTRHLLVLIALPIALVMLVSLITFSDVRFRHPIDPLILILAGVGVEAAIRRLRRRSSP